MGPEAFDYALPPERIAQAPAPRRGDARMLVALELQRRHAHARQLPELLPADALVVVNASKVVPARVDMTRDDDRSFELLVCDPSPAQGPGATVRAWVRGAKRLHEGDRLHAGALTLRMVGADPIDPRARIFAVEHGEILRALHAHGRVPLPPYVQRPPDADDRVRYQTVYADREGSVAAPTAGLHLDHAQLAALDIVPLHLHVGPGTFLPMDVPDVRHHRVGPERVQLSEDSAARLRAAMHDRRPIVAIGTTVTRALEGIALRHGELRAFDDAIDLVITPGFAFSVVTHLFTNFHLPRSSLLMLVCSFAGRGRVLSCYEEAVAMGYRFYSYGDCMLVDRIDGGEA